MAERIFQIGSVVLGLQIYKHNLYNRRKWRRGWPTLPILLELSTERNQVLGEKKKLKI